ncbi:uroporphyrinogen-III synthase [Paraglaciecola sp.]|uniref:uroporphyrinogen-III synthase n=1 Tax=Paraglaciecola sp. TaxID=1920173 RepID=UPI00273CF8A1|nr:uroporphyrinogen-III synthase [Paraglaciecola sp.]MDP5029669.1 uroporphyrinogen-III synthase [Paraglaciecola sp.]
MSFLIFRPQAKCVSSAQAFANEGLNAVACGLIDTELDEQALAALPHHIAQLSTQSLVIVTSTVAAEQCVLFKSMWPSQVQFFAVGQSTADILNQAGLTAIVPTEARSEGLLALPMLNDVADKTVIIIKGFGGRELLADTLTLRGAKVREWALYKRVALAKPFCTRQWHHEQIQCIIATSGEVIAAAFNHYAASWLQTKLWIVVSERTADIAYQFGITQVQISDSASDQALIKSAKAASHRP